MALILTGTGRSYYAIFRYGNHRYIITGQGTLMR
jgi:hypothetical protein